MFVLFAATPVRVGGFSRKVVVAAGKKPGSEERALWHSVADDGDNYRLVRDNRS